MTTKIGKSAGLDEISSEKLKALGSDFVAILFKFFNQLYDEGALPKEMSKLVFLPLPKTTGTLRFEEHKTKSLMLHLTKILIKVLCRRNKPKIDNQLNTQDGLLRSDSETLFHTRNSVYPLKCMLMLHGNVERYIFVLG